ncbi:hypothetical protein K491DRAFT_696113 [Lophiostoma macrostomum CBS 122681]|uniref:DUF7702 domain-containing protein n=1 Tax=Lophiostoma macrostomum CBS 122681 TaxID=1314788 RepID=A0A6A6SVZ5_9PLEO|nr:hypothetical protein K491DRAFT_696113 [Lophiostoma macrostomum CBS 122681]
MLDAHGWVSVVDLIIYDPALVVAALVCFRHGFRKGSGWIYTLVLCLVRIIGSICRLVSINHPSERLITTTFVLDSVGLGPLLLATMGLLSRFVAFINAHAASRVTTLHFRIIKIVITVGLVLSVVGGISGYKTQPDGSIKIPTESKVGVILFIPAFVALILILFVSLPHTAVVPPKERRVPVAVAFAFPFVAVRLLYSILAVYLHNHTFGVLNGSVVVWALMAVVEEFIVVIMYLTLGFLVDPRNAEDSGSSPWSSTVERAERHVKRTRERTGGYEMARGAERQGLRAGGHQSTGVV